MKAKVWSSLNVEVQYTDAKIAQPGSQADWPSIDMKKRSSTQVQPLQCVYVPESAIDYAAIFGRGGRNSGDEDFALFKCPSCSHVYLMDYEVDTVYVDGNDLSQREGVSDPQYPRRLLVCVHCKRRLPKGKWIGPHAEEQFQVTWSELDASAWSWVAKPLDSLDDKI